MTMEAEGASIQVPEFIVARFAALNEIQKEIPKIWIYFPDALTDKVLAGTFLFLRMSIKLTKGEEGMEYLQCHFYQPMTQKGENQQMVQALNSRSKWKALMLT